MKKTLLSLACALLVGTAAQAQTSPWTVIGVSPVAPGQLSRQIVAVNAATVWCLYSDPGSTAVPSPAVRVYARTTDGGTTWTGGAINIPANLSVSNITAIDGNTAWVAAYATQAGAISSQGIFKTTDGGVTWTPQNTGGSGTIYSSSESFPNVVYFWDANNGVTMGDALNHTQPNARLEIYTTTNGGASWTRNNAAPIVKDAAEYGLSGSYYVIGNTIWHGSLSDNGTGARLFKSVDKGLTWTTHNTDLADAVNNIAFSTPMNGLLASGYDVTSTTDGGVTNFQTFTSGTFRSAGMDAVPGLNNVYVSVGVPDGGTSADNGSSISYDGGANWTNMNPSTVNMNQYEIDMLSPAVGYTGSFTQATTANPNVSVTGVTKLNRVLDLTLATQNSKALRGALQVYPNPSNDGRFLLNVNMTSIKRDLTVTDALGRVVKQVKLNATGNTVQNQTLDLSQCKAGLYTLRLETEHGTTVEKLVIK